MNTATKAPKVRDALTLRDTTDLLLAVDAYIEQHIDELELNGGVLPDDLAAMLDEVIAAREAKAEAIVFKLDQFGGFASSAKATKDRAARREKVWNNTIAALKAYALREVERNGGEKIKAPSATLRIQVNGQPSTEIAFDNEQLLAFADAGAGPLVSYITVKRVASVDSKALAAAYEARRVQLLDEAQTYDTLIEPDEPEFEESWKTVLQLRASHVAEGLAAEFPGVKCTRGFHLRID